MALQATEPNGLLSRLTAYVHDELVPLEDELARTGIVPEDVFRQMRSMGLCGLTIPQTYGGMGLNLSQEVEAVMALSWASAAFRSVIGVNLTIGSQALVMDGTEDQKSRWLPSIASGDTISCFAMSEPEAGSDMAAISTRATRDGEAYRLNGTKRFITNASRAALIIALARTSDDRQPGHGHISAFLVPGNSEGLSLGKPNRMMGQAGVDNASIEFSDTPLPTGSLLGGIEGRGFHTAMKVLDRSRIHVAAVCVGQMQRIVHEALQHSLKRHQYGKPLARLQLIQAMLADSEAELYAAASMTRAAAMAYDAGETVTRQAACCKMFASEALGRVADRAVQIAGGDGYMAGHVIERFYRDARVFRIYEGATQVQQVVIARDMIHQAGVQ